MIEVRKLSVALQSGPVLLSDISFDVTAPQLIGVYGANGSGKSTLLKAIQGSDSVGCVRQGEVWYSDKVENLELRLDHLPPEDKAAYIQRFQSEIQSAFHMSVIDILNVSEALLGARVGFTVQDVMDLCGVAELSSRSLSTLSEGERQLVLLSQAVLHPSKLLLLDETFSKIDVVNIHVVGNVLRQLVRNGVTVLLVSHDINFLTEFSDRLLFMKNGKVCYDGDIEDALTPEKLDLIFPGVYPEIVRSSKSGKLKVFFTK